MRELFKIFSFSEQAPMDFTQLDFWVFFAGVYVVFALLYQKITLRNAFLFLASVFFYYKTSGVFVFLLFFSTIADFFLGKWLFTTSKETLRRLYLFVSLFLNLGVLSYFKYAYFFTDSYNYLFHTDYEVFNYLAHWGNGFFSAEYFRVDSIILPVGISFYTFQTMSYTIDIYRGKLKPLNSILDFAFFVSFFPQLVAGPIVRAEQFLPQTHKKTIISVDAFNKGSYFILKGMVKKIIFANFIAVQFLDLVFDSPSMYSGFANLMALIGYSLQVYGDFAGYTDIAIGLALLMGFELPKNFNSPYKATSCGDFWHRWHMSLSTWLRDYLYIPLGGNRGGTWASVIIALLFIITAVLAVNNPYFSIVVGLLVLLCTYGAYKSSIVRKHISTNINTMLTMLIGGLWHGAHWKFILWGGINGLGVVWYKYWRKISPYEHSTHWLAHLWKVFSTFTFIVLVRLFFRANDLESVELWWEQVWNHFEIGRAIDVLIHFWQAFVVMFIGYTVHWLPEQYKNSTLTYYNESPLWGKAVVVMLVVIICYQAHSAGSRSFIYFQF